MLYDCVLLWVYVKKHECFLAPLHRKTHQKWSQVDLRYIEFLFRFATTPYHQMLYAGRIFACVSWMWPNEKLNHFAFRNFAEALNGKRIWLHGYKSIFAGNKIYCSWRTPMRNMKGRLQRLPFSSLGKFSGMEERSEHQLNHPVIIIYWRLTQLDASEDSTRTTHEHGGARWTKRGRKRKRRSFVDGYLHILHSPKYFHYVVVLLKAKAFHSHFTCIKQAFKLIFLLHGAAVCRYFQLQFPNVKSLKLIWRL